MRRLALAAVLTTTAFALALLPSYGHGDVDQEFVGPFTASPPLASVLAQSFTPAQATLVGVDVFLSTDGAVAESAASLTIDILDAADWSVVLGSGTGSLPAGTNSTNAEPYLLHVDFSSSITLTPETRYVIRLGIVPLYRWAAEISAPYTRGVAYVAGTPISAYDFGFRTYSSAAAPIDTTPPDIAYDIDPDLPVSGWYRDDVTLTWSVTDLESESNVEGCENQEATTDRDLATYSCAASSEGGAAGPVSVTFGRDTVAPTILATVTAGTLSNGWYRSEVTVSFTCADDRSGISDGDCPGSETLSTDGVEVSSTERTVTDRAGNPSLASNIVTVSIDRTAPEVTITPDREPDNGEAYDHAITFSATGTDAGSGLSSCDAPKTYSGPASSSASVEMTCTDLAGNVGTATYSFAFTDPPEDTTPPTIIATILSGTKGHGDWYLSDVVVHFSCADDSSGIPDGNCPADQTLDTEGTSVSSIAMTVFDAAGNESAPSNVITVSIDKTAPNAEASATPVPNGAGWNNTAVTVTFSGTDAVSGGVTCDEPVILTTDGAGQSAIGDCEDAAGNSGSATIINVNIDRTAPVVAIVPNRPTDTVDGYDHAVTFTASGDDGSGGSGVAHCDAPEIYSGPISGAASVEMACADNAGNIGTKTVTFAYVDSTPPVITFLLSPNLPVGGWYTSNVTLTWTVVEAESPGALLVAGCEDQAVTSDRLYTRYTCAASSAGGEASVVEVEFGRDATKPSIVATIEGTAGTDSWFTSDINVRFACSDGGSGVAIDTVPDIEISTEGAAHSVVSSGNCTDHAGNVADPITVSGIKIDKTGPTATIEVTAGTLGQGGWYTSDVVVRTSGTDNVSGPVSCSADQTLSADAATHTFTGSCSNAAGLTTEATSLTVKLDETPPALAPSLSSDEVAPGGSLTIAPNATDATSGVASSSCASPDTATVGAHSVSCTATDHAGNSATRTVEYEVTSSQGVIIYGFRPPAGGGYGTFSFGGGTFEELLGATGCSRTTSVFFFNKTDGTFAAWIPGAQVAAVNAEFLAIFAGTPPLPDGIIFTARCV